MEVDVGTSLSCWLLLSLCLKSILAGHWSVQLPVSPVCAVVGSSVVLPCSFNFPQSSLESESNKVGGLPAQDDEGEAQQYRVLSQMWCLGNSRCVTPTYIFHSAGILPDPSFMGRVEYFGQPGTNNCSLRISDLRQSDSGTYVFYLITDHPTEKMPDQSGIQLLVAASSSTLSVAAGPSSRVIEGETLSLACCSPAAGQGVSYTWFKGADVGPRHRGQVWNISQATSADSGGYVCQVQAGLQAQNSTVLNIDVEYSPRNTAVSISPASGRLPITLTCTSEANPPVHTYAWYRGAACRPSADKSSHRANWSMAEPAGAIQTLSTSSITAEVYGEHCCVAGNRHGSQTDTITLQGPRTITPSDSSESRLVPIGVGVGVLLVVVVMAVCFVTRKQKSSRQSSYVLTETSPVVP